MRLLYPQSWPKLGCKWLAVLAKRPLQFEDPLRSSTLGKVQYVCSIPFVQSTAITLVQVLFVHPFCSMYGFPFCSQVSFETKPLTSRLSQNFARLRPPACVEIGVRMPVRGGRQALLDGSRETQGKPKEHRIMAGFQKSRGLLKCK